MSLSYLREMKSGGLLFLLVTALMFAHAQRADILIRNGKILDGTGNSWYYGDVAIKDGKILVIGKGLTIYATKTLDASGLIVSPGFIDVHTHIEGDEMKGIE